LVSYVENGGTYLGYGEGGGVMNNVCQFIDAEAYVSGDFGGYNNGVVETDYDPNDAISAYYPQNSYSFVFFPVWFQTGEDVKASVKYTEDGSNLLVSGWWPHYEEAAGYSMVVTGTCGGGNVILTGTDPMFRAHTEFTFRLVANSIFSSAEH